MTIKFIFFIYVYMYTSTFLELTVLFPNIGVVAK